MPWCMKTNKQQLMKNSHFTTFFFTYVHLTFIRDDCVWSVLLYPGDSSVSTCYGIQTDHVLQDHPDWNPPHKFYHPKCANWKGPWAEGKSRCSTHSLWWQHSISEAHRKPIITSTGQFSRGRPPSCPSLAYNTWSPSKTWRKERGTVTAVRPVHPSLHPLSSSYMSSSFASSFAPSTNTLHPASSSGVAPTPGREPAEPRWSLPTQPEPPVNQKLKLEPGYYLLLRN